MFIIILMMMDTIFLTERIAAIKALIIVYETAASSLMSDSIQSYTLDTGQSRQVVTKIDIARINDKISALYNQLTILQNRLNGSNTSIVRPAW